MKNHSVYNPNVSGYDDTFNPIIGYGIAIESIRYWLDIHDLDINMSKIQKPLNIDNDTEIEDYILTDYIEQANGSAEIEYVVNYNTDESFIMRSFTNFKYDSQTIPSTKKVTTQIINTLYRLYEIPLNLRNNFENYCEDAINEIWQLG